MYFADTILVYCIILYLNYLLKKKSWGEHCLSSVHNMMQDLALHCVELAKHKNIQIFAILHDKTQEWNIKEHKDWIRVHPCIALRCDKHQSESNTSTCVIFWTDLMGHPALYMPCIWLGTWGIHLTNESKMVSSKVFAGFRNTPVHLPYFHRFSFSAQIHRGPKLQERELQCIS